MKRIYWSIIGLVVCGVGGFAAALLDNALIRSASPTAAIQSIAVALVVYVLAGFCFGKSLVGHWPRKAALLVLTVVALLLAVWIGALFFGSIAAYRYYNEVLYAMEMALFVSIMLVVSSPRESGEEQITLSSGALFMRVALLVLILTLMGIGFQYLNLQMLLSTGSMSYLLWRGLLGMVGIVLAGICFRHGFSGPLAMKPALVIWVVFLVLALLHYYPVFSGAFMRTLLVFGDGISLGLFMSTIYLFNPKAPARFGKKDTPFV